MTDLASLTAPLLRATARARSLKDSTLVVKLGGSAMEDPAATAGTLDSIAVLYQLGLHLILVHGGGKPIDRAMAVAGLTPKKVMGRRYTDAATLGIVRSVLRDINRKLAADLMERGVAVLSFFHESDASLDESPFTFQRLALTNESGEAVDLGYVGGEVVSGDNSFQLFGMFLKKVPLLASIAREDGSEQWLNINADSMAAAIGRGVNVGTVMFLTDTPGVLANRADPHSLFARLTVAECKDLIAHSVIEGGMIPKVEACFEALEAGAKRAVILDGRNPHSLLSEFVSDAILGTEIVP